MQRILTFDFLADFNNLFFEKKKKLVKVSVGREFNESIVSKALKHIISRVNYC